MKSTKGKIFFAVFAIAFCVLAYFAADIPFFTFADPLARASLTTVTDGEALHFTYEDDAITLHAGGEASVYALTYSGTAVVSGGEASSLPDDLTGSFAAVASPVTTDVDGDGTLDTLIAAAKTDMDFTQGYTAVANQFANEVIPFELVFEERTRFVAYQDGQPLSNATLRVQRADGATITSQTDESGVIDGVGLTEAWAGIIVFCHAADGTWYSMAYQVEDNTLLTSRWLSAMRPFAVILGISALCILLDVLLRKRLYRKNGQTERAAAVGHVKRIRRPFDLMTHRWLTMLVSFVLLIWGGRWFGLALSCVELPVFACPYNLDQLTSAGCYYLSHLDVLLASSWREILWFVGSFLVSAVLFGRALCGFVCPMGFLQDIAHEARQALHVEGIALTERLYAILRLVKWLVLVVFLGVGLVGGSFCDLCPALAVSPALAGFKTSLYLSGFIMVLVLVSGFIMVLVLVSGFFKRRCFCNVCPLGFLVGLVHRFSLFRLKKDVIACTECGACYEACPMGIKSVLTVREGKGDLRRVDVTTSDCLLCGECVRRCPEDHALALTFCGKKLYDASRMRFLRDYATPVKERKETHD